MSAFDFIHKFGVLRARDMLKGAPFETTHIGSDDDGLYYMRDNEQGIAIFNRPNREWWGIRPDQCVMYDLPELKTLVEAFDLVREIGPDKSNYLKGKSVNFWMKGLKYSQAQIIHALGLVKAFEGGQWEHS